MKENAVKMSATYKAYDRTGTLKKRQGRKVGVIAVKAKDAPSEEFNPLSLLWIVDPYRKDYNQVVKQIDSIKKARLPKYETDLFHSCFKNW